MNGPLRGLNPRLRNEANERVIAPQRRRRHDVFKRVLLRLSVDPAWVLNGGFCLELRLGLRARATKDLDLVSRVGGMTSALGLQDLLVAALEEDPANDGFRFLVRLPCAFAGADPDAGAWRRVVDARLSGAEFVTTTLDVVTRGAEVQGGVMTRTLTTELPGREAGLLDAAALALRLEHVWRERDGAPPPGVLPDPPVGWAIDYQRLAVETGANASTTTEAFALLADLYGRARPLIPPHPDDQENR